MAERRVTDRRKRAPEARVNVTRGEFEQQRALLSALTEAVARLDRKITAVALRLDELLRDLDRRKIPR